jgi:hypothetical protein
VLQGAVERLDRAHFSASPPDEYFWSLMREAMLAACATDGEIDALAAHFIVWTVENTVPRSEERRGQIELIADSLACTAVTVGIGGGDTHVRVEFPSRESVH